MITGFNTDIESGGKVYHVQTEDKGQANPIVETLVYTGGQIVCARKTSYADHLASGELPESAIQQLMENQHRGLIREIHDGTLTKEDLEPFGWKIITDRSFEEVVRSFLDTEVPLDKIRVALLDPKELRTGERPTLTLEVTDDMSERPVVGASVVVELVCKDGAPAQLFSASTDGCGRVQAPCDLPAKPGARPTLVCRAEAAGTTAEVRCKVKRRRARASVQRA